MYTLLGICSDLDSHSANGPEHKHLSMYFFPFVPNRKGLVSILQVLSGFIESSEEETIGHGIFLQLSTRFRRTNCSLQSWPKQQSIWISLIWASASSCLKMECIIVLWFWLKFQCWNSNPISSDNYSGCKSVKYEDSMSSHVSLFLTHVYIFFRLGISSSL